ncbi:MAG: tetratricopeptide repeat protein [Akkermansia sp.]|nr:tetratricopeptide repeat protein [Akkermansia sp.]
MSALSTYTTMALGGIMLLSSSTIWAQSRGYTQPGTVVAGPTRQAPHDPAEDLLVAYRLRNEAEKAAARGNYNQALKKARQAEKMMAIIVRDHPNWKTNMMSYLREQLAKNIARYGEEAKKAPIPTGRQPGKAVPQEVSFDLPGITKNAQAEDGVFEDGLPDAAATDKELREELARLRAECKKMAQSFLDLSEKYKKSQQELLTARSEQKEYKERYETLLKQVTEERRLNNEVVDSFARRLAEAEDKLRESERARKAAEEKASQLAGQLAQTQAELERVTRERDALKAENEQLRAIVELNSPEKTKALLDQNLTLAEQLKAARARVEALEAQLAGSSDEKDVLAQQLTEARSEVDQLREQMGLVYDENRGYRRRVSELTERLNNMEAELNAQANKPQIDPALAEENQILRDVIAKQRRTLEMQEQGRKLLMETYQKLKNDNSEMAAELQRLDNESRLELTDAEKRLIESLRKGSSPGEQDADSSNAVRRSLEIQTLASLADKAFSKSRYTSAEQLYRTLYDYQPDHVPGLVNLGTILLYRNKCEEATEYLTRATRLAPEQPITYYLAGISYYRRDCMEEAERMFIRTIELDPGNAEAFFYLANIEGISGRHDEALKHFAAAVKLKPGLNDAHYNMARLYAEMGRIPDAARAYDRAIQSGAEPDPEFDNYLRTHPDNVKKPGADLVAEIEPEEEAARLRADDEEVQKILADNADPAADATAEPRETPEPEPPAPANTSGYTPEQQAVADEVARLQALDIQAAPTPSSAGAGHKTDKKRFSSVRVRTNAGGYRHRVRLRLKLPEPQRLRERGGDIKELKPKKTHRRRNRNK